MSSESTPATAATPATTDDTSAPIPPRYWWLKRIALGVVLLLALLLGLRLAWGAAVARHVDRVLADYESAGVPLRLSAFRRPRIPDDQNAVVDLRRADASYVDPVENLPPVRDLARSPETWRDDPTIVVRTLAANEAALNAVRAAAAKPDAQWGETLTVQAYMGRAFNYPGTGPVRLLFVQSLFAHRIGDDTLTLESLQQVRSIAEKFNEAQTLVGLLRGASLWGGVARNIQEVAPALDLATDERIAECEALIEGLLDDRSVQEGLTRSLAIERAWMVGLLAAFLPLPDQQDGPQLSPGNVTPFYAPVAPALTVDALCVVGDYDAFMAAAHAANATSARADVSSIEEARVNGIERLTHRLSALAPLSFKAIYLIRFKAAACRRIAAVRLGIRLYVCDHGHRPATLDQLVPDYLPFVPEDPLFADGRPLRYVPDGDDAGLTAGAPDDALANPKLDDWPVSMRLDPPGHHPTPVPTSRPRQKDDHDE
jgi:hypothetical protein